MQKRALIVDEERATCEMVERVMTSVGIECISINQSEEAGRVLRSGRFSVVILDYEMTYPDGLALTRQMRTSGSNRMTPVVLMSRDQRPGAMAKGFEAGASFFLYKPVDKERLLRLLRATQGAMEQVQRRTRRVALKSGVKLGFCGQEIECETIDISMEGLLIKTPRAVPVGSSVNISLQLGKAAKPMVGAGSVVRMHGTDQMGIHLGRLTVVESQRLQEFLLSMVPGE
jgi:DNA-binding response OmpR family regulator